MVHSALWFGVDEKTFENIDEAFPKRRRYEISCDFLTKFSKMTSDQGWIQTSATSFQKLGRIVKKLKKKQNRKPCQKVLTARCQFLPGV